MKLQIVADASAWLLCFVVVACVLPLTDWWAAEGFPRHLDRDTLAVAIIVALCWVALRALAGHRAVRGRSPVLSVALALVLPVSAWVCAWGMVWLAASTTGGWLVDSGHLNSVPRLFSLVPVILAAGTWGLISPGIFQNPAQRMTHAPST